MNTAYRTLIEMQTFAAACVQFDRRVPNPRNPYLPENERHGIWQQEFEAAQIRVHARFSGETA